MRHIITMADIVSSETILTFCVVHLATDKSVPDVVQCPNDTRVVNSTSRLMKVFWPEPVFTDNVGVINLTQSHRPGTLCHILSSLLVIVSVGCHQPDTESQTRYTLSHS